METGAVGDIDERNPRLGIPPRAHPTLDGHRPACGNLASEYLLDAGYRHDALLSMFLLDRRNEGMVDAPRMICALPFVAFRQLDAQNLQ
jgi:hypothetical protein